MKKNLTQFGALCLGALAFFGCDQEDELNNLTTSKEWNSISDNCYTVDFENFSAGDFPITQVTGGFGTVGVFAKKRTEGDICDTYVSDNVARVYDAKVHTGDDGHDLGVPDHLGKMLIANQYTPEEVKINGDKLDAQGYKYSDPNDNAWGSTLEIDFAGIPGAVMLKSIVVVDVDNNDVYPTKVNENESYVRVIDSNNKEYNFPLTTYSHEGSVQTVTMNVANAKKMIVVFDGINTSVGSGAIDNIVFCVDKPAEELNGCTRTQGYWKNHATGKKAVPVWKDISKTNFFTSGMTYLEVLKTSPKGGDEYYILAHQYIAAYLNQTVNKAAMPANVKTVFETATVYFRTWPNPKPAVSRSTLIEWADVLDKYNNGKMGVAHCD